MRSSLIATILALTMAAVPALALPEPDALAVSDGFLEDVKLGTWTSATDTSIKTLIIRPAKRGCAKEKCKDCKSKCGGTALCELICYAGYGCTSC